MRLLVEGVAAVAIDDRRAYSFSVEVFDFGGDIKEALCSEEIICFWSADASAEGDVLVEFGVRGAVAEVKVLRAALGIEAVFYGDGFEEGGLA